MADEGGYKVSVLHDSDISGSALDEKKVCVIGYGIQGRAQACNFKDSGLDVVIGLRPGSKSEALAKKDGFAVLPMAEAAKAADIICILVPDMMHRKVYEESVAPSLRAGKTLYFSHGFSIVFGQVVAPKDVDVVMVAPKSPGKRVRETYEEGFGTPALAAVYQDASGNARKTVLALSKALGCSRAGVFECTFKQETLSDLFGEQAVLCGGVSELIKAGFQTLVERGYPPEIAYFECLHELKLIVDLIQSGGISFMYNQVSETARYGGWTRGTRIITSDTRREMSAILDEVEDGRFAREWISENQAGKKKFDELDAKEKSELIEKVGFQIRQLFVKKQNRVT